MTLEFKMPKLGESVTEGTIGRWLKQPGETLAQYEPLLEVTTDKVDTEVSAPIDGRLLEILVAEGETVAVGTIIARLADAATNGAATVSAAPAATAAPTTMQAARSAPISPVVARIAAEHGVDLAQVAGTGAGGRVSKRDVERFVAQRQRGAAQPSAALAEPPAEIKAELQQSMESAPTTEEQEREPDPTPLPVRAGFKPAQTAPTAQTAPLAQTAPIPAVGPDDEIIPISPMRRAIAEHMVRSKRVAPHVTTVMEADLSRIVAHRAAHRADYERQGVKLTFTPYFVQAVVAALQEVPLVNASYADDGITLHQRINVGVAVAIPDGLIVPVLKDADERSLLGLSRAVGDLAERARSRKLLADETQGGTFTITNHGVSGSLFAMPIINQPQAAILGIGALQKRAVVVSDRGQDAIAIRPMCYLSLTFDHRLVDGATADQFLGIVKRALESYEA